MQRYSVTGQSVSFISGILALQPEQAASRATALADLGEGFYEVIGPVQFKRGEEFGYDGDVNKLLMESLTEIAEREMAKKKGETLEKIAGAANLEALNELVPQDEQDEEILAAAEARAVELENA